MHTPRFVLLLSLSLCVLCTAFARAESPVTVHHDAPQVVNLATTRSFAVEFYMSGVDVADDLVTLHTDVGLFPNGERTIDISLKEKRNQWFAQPIMLGHLAELTVDVLKVWATHDTETLSTVTVALRRVQSITWLDKGLFKPEIFPRTHPLPAIAHAVIRDQHGDGLAGVPAYLRYSVPDAQPGMIAGITNARGYLTFLVPASTKECDIACQIFTEFASSDTLKIPCIPDHSITDRLPYRVEIAVPEEARNHTSVPVLVTVTGDGTQPLPDKILLTSWWGIFQEGKSNRQVVALNDGITSATLELNVPGHGTCFYVRIFASTCDENGKEIQPSVIAMKDIRIIQDASTCDVTITPYPHANYPGSVGTLTVSARDEWGDRIADISVRYSNTRPGDRFSRQVNTDERGIASFPIFPSAIKGVVEYMGTCHASTYSLGENCLVQYDAQGRLIGYGFRGKITNHFVYDKDGKVTEQE